jgi:hypothetical protein
LWDVAVFADDVSAGWCYRFRAWWRDRCRRSNSPSYRPNLLWDRRRIVWFVEIVDRQIEFLSFFRQWYSVRGDKVDYRRERILGVLLRVRYHVVVKCR